MTRYKLPDELGGRTVDAEETWGGCAGARPEYRIGDITLTMPPGTPLKVMPPAEPPPGPYLLDGGAVVICTSPGDWWVPNGRGNPGVFRYMWPGFWEKFGGPDVTLVPLVPDPAAGVQLPWAGESAVLATRLGVCTHDPGEGGSLVQELYGSRDALLHPDTAEAKGAALIAAARAARTAVGT